MTADKTLEELKAAYAEAVADAYIDPHEAAYAAEDAAYRASHDALKAQENSND